MQARMLAGNKAGQMFSFSEDYIYLKTKWGTALK